MTKSMEVSTVEHTALVAVFRRCGYVKIESSILADTLGDICKLFISEISSKNQLSAIENVIPLDKPFDGEIDIFGKARYKEFLQLIMQEDTHDSAARYISRSEVLYTDSTVDMTRMPILSNSDGHIFENATTSPYSAFSAGDLHVVRTHTSKIAGRATESQDLIIYIP